MGVFRINRYWAVGAFVLLLGFVLLNSSPSSVNARTLTPQPAPELTTKEAHYWINSEPLTWEQLKGQVVLVDFWTFECWNCYRSFPWLNDLEERYVGKGLTVLGVHTPEFFHEHDVDAVRAKVKEFGLKHPVMMDNEYAFWTGMNNRFWPSYYLIDKQGRVRALFVGETHIGDARAQAVEQMIDLLLAEDGDSERI